MCYQHIVGGGEMYFRQRGCNRTIFLSQKRHLLSHSLSTHTLESAFRVGDCIITLASTLPYLTPHLNNGSKIPENSRHPTSIRFVNSELFDGC